MAGYLPGDYYGAYPQQPPAPIGFEMQNQPAPYGQQPPYPARNDIYPAPQYGQPAQQSYATPYEANPHQPAGQNYGQPTNLPPVGFEGARYTPDNDNRSRQISERPRTAETQDTTDATTRTAYRVKEVGLFTNLSI